MKYLIVIVLIATNLTILAQSIEFYAGNQRTGVDLMWYKFIQNKNDENTPILFFSRNRASVDYDNQLGAFGSVNAFSFNLKNGLGLVSVASFLNSGLRAKIGLQYAKQKDTFLFFGWAVIDLKNEASVDVFGLFRYQPRLNGRWRLFSQIELFPVYNPRNQFWNLTQRVRVGPKYHKFTFGFMADFNQAGSTEFQTHQNFGGFLRYDF